MEYLKGTQFLKRGQEKRKKRINGLEKQDKHLQERKPRQVTENQPSIQSEESFQLKGSIGHSWKTTAEKTRCEHVLP